MASFPLPPPSYSPSKIGVSLVYPCRWTGPPPCPFFSRRARPHAPQTGVASWSPCGRFMVASLLVFPCFASTKPDDTVNFVGKISPPPFGARVPLPAPAPDLA